MGDTTPACTRYYLLDGFGHTRVLLTPQGTVAEVWSYDSWGFPIRHEVSPYVEYIPQPLTWNAAFGYEWDCFADTGLYHVGAREYDPRTARWLQRDPIDAASGDPNLYRYCGNDPVNCADPTGLDWLDNTANFFAGWGDRLTGDLTKYARDWLCDLLNLPRFEVDPCDEWYLAGHLVGAVHDRLLTRGVGRGGNAPKLNPWGRRGGPQHQAKIQQVEQQYKNQGYIHIAGGSRDEQAVPTHGGHKDKRYPDLIFVDPQTGEEVYVNVGRTDSRGNPVRREQQALNDLRQRASPPSRRPVKQVDFYPYP